MVVTSPPYYGLRSYDVAKWDGGDPSCDHATDTQHQKQGASSQRAGRSNADEQRNENFRDVCGKCGAKRVDRQIGLEQTPQEYVEQMVQVFREVWRVLKPHGTAWLNLGDSYAGSGKGGNPDEGKQSTNGDAARRAQATNVTRKTFEIGAKPKDLLGIPWRVALALQSDGWYLRSDIIWHKPNTMPESVTDRPTKSHEYLFLLSKSQHYFYDAEAIAEPATDALYAQVEQGYSGEGLKDYDAAGVQNPSSVKARIIGNARKRADRIGGNKHTGDTTQHSDGSVYTGNLTRNKRSVWTITTKPYRGAHFATMPEDLVEPCVLAGCPVGGMVMDPFCGTGTVIAVAERLGRRGVGVDLGYQELAKERTSQRGLPLEMA